MAQISNLGLTARTGIAAAGALLLVAMQARPQAAEPCRDAQNYPGPEPVNIAENGALRVGLVYGRVVVQARTRHPGSSLHGDACLTLFTEKSHAYVASVQINAAGRFAFGRVAPGGYRLVARSPGFCTGNIPIRVTSSRRKRRILVIFQGPAIDDCTTGGYDLGGPP
jgi:hypothetical protein